MKILVTIPFTEEQKNLIETAAAGNDIVFLAPEQLTDEMIQNAEIIIGNLPASVIKTASNLKWLQLNSAGADAYCVPGVLSEDAVLTNASGAYDISVSEAMVAGTFGLFKKIYSYYDNQKEHLWKDEGMVQSAYGACVVVLGLGNIGLSYARKMKAMGSHVIGIKRHVSSVPEGVDEVYSIDELENCLKRADIVVSVLPGTPETEHMMGKAQFQAMKNTAYFINVGRGNFVDQDALYEALENGEIAGAMLDVTEPEPLPSDHKLWDAKNLYIMPHVAGGFHIPVTLDTIANICADNLQKYLKGETLKNIVDKSKGY